MIASSGTWTRAPRNQEKVPQNCLFLVHGPEPPPEGLGSRGRSQELEEACGFRGLQKSPEFSRMFFHVPKTQSLQVADPSAAPEHCLSIAGVRPA